MDERLEKKNSLTVTLRSTLKPLFLSFKNFKRFF